MTTLRLLALCTLTSLIAGSCGSPPTAERPYTVLIRAFDTEGEPLRGLRVMAAGRELGATAAGGRLQLRLMGTEGQRVDFEATCPEGYNGPRERASLLLKTFQRLSPGAEQQTELRQTCQAIERVTAVVIRSGEPKIPVRLRDQELTRTSEQGIAHVVFKQKSGISFRLTLDTHEQADLRPQSPSRIFMVGERDELVIWDQPFEKAKPKPRPKRRPPPPPARPPIPYRLQAKS